MKLAAEKYVLMYAHQHAIASRILRISNAYGPGQSTTRGQGAVAVFLGHHLAGQQIEIFGDGSVVRDFVYVEDIAAVVAQLLGRRDAPAVLNLGAGVGTSMNELLDLVEHVVGRGPMSPTAPDDPSTSAVSCSISSASSRRSTSSRARLPTASLRHGHTCARTRPARSSTT